MTDSDGYSTDEGYTDDSSDRSLDNLLCSPAIARASATQADIGHAAQVISVVIVHQVVQFVPVTFSPVVDAAKWIQPATNHTNIDESKCTDGTTHIDTSQVTKRLIKWSLPPPSTPLVPFPFWLGMVL